MERDRSVGTPAFWTGVLGLEGFEVVHQRHDSTEKAWQFTLAPTLAAGVCPDCGRPSADRHQTRDRERIHDLPIGDSRVELTLRTLQYECPACRRCFTPPPPRRAGGRDACYRAVSGALRPTDPHGRHPQCCGVLRPAREGPGAVALRFSGAAAESDGAGRGERPIRSIGIDELSVKKGGAVSSR